MLKRLLKMPSSPSLRRLTTAVMVVAVMALSASAASASTVTFSSSATFNGSPTLVIGAVTLSFQPVVNGSVNAPSNTSLGEIVLGCTGGLTTCAPANLAGTNFNILVTQTVPSAGNGTITSTLSGTFSGDSTDGLITFNVTSITIGGVVYTILNNPLSLVPNTTNAGHTSIQAHVTPPAPVPEPASMLLLGTGLLGFASSVRRRFVRR